MGFFDTIKKKVTGAITTDTEKLHYVWNDDFSTRVTVTLDQNPTGLC